MFAYDMTFDPEVVLGHYDLISQFSDFSLYLSFQFVYEHNCFHDMFTYDKIFDPKVFLGHCDLISWFSDFALYLDTQLVFFFSYFFHIMNNYDQTFNPNILIGHCDLISLFSDFALFLSTQVGFGLMFDKGQKQSSTLSCNSSYLCVAMYKSSSGPLYKSCQPCSRGSLALID